MMGFNIIIDNKFRGRIKTPPLFVIDPTPFYYRPQGHVKEKIPALTTLKTLHIISQQTSANQSNTQQGIYLPKGLLLGVPPLLRAKISDQFS